MRSLALAVILAAWLFAAAGNRTGASDNVAGFSELPAGDTLKIDYVSRGCFGGDHFEFTYGRVPVPEMSVLEHTERWQGDTPMGEETDYLGMAKLSPQDLQYLDNVFAFYRIPATHGSTTTVTIHISQLHNGVQVAGESITDDSGFPDLIKYSHPEEYKYLTLPEVVQRLRKKRASG
jgi:hypothetical protein